VTDSEMVEVISVDDHEQALAIMELLKAKGVPDVGFWPKDVLDTSVGTLSGGPLPLQPPYRSHAKEPLGPFAVYVPESGGNADPRSGFGMPWIRAYPHASVANPRHARSIAAHWRPSSERADRTGAGGVRCWASAGPSGMLGA
jgi:hypothetical protein